MAMEEVDKDKNIKKTLITKIFAYFLTAIGPKLNEDAYKEVFYTTIKDGYICCIILIST
jgi:hypothetical protein